MKCYLPKNHKSIYPTELYERLKYNLRGDYLEVNFITWLYLKIFFLVRLYLIYQIAEPTKKSLADNVTEDYMKSM